MTESQKKEWKYVSEVFGEPGGPKGRYDQLHFNADKLRPTMHFVAWVDLMGAANAMSLSTAKASNFIAKMHDAALKARTQFGDVKLSPITDGFFATVPQQKYLQLIGFLDRVYRSLAFRVMIEPNKHRFLIRGAVAFGPFVQGDKVADRLDDYTPEEHACYMENVIIGTPLSKAYEAESNAPPFGIYMDDSVLEFGRKSSSERVHHWWDPSSKAQSTWTKRFGNEIISFLEWEKKNSLNLKYPVEKHDKYVAKVTEYFML